MSELIDTQLSPMMQQWHACKAKAKEALLFFRLGDFYEAFFEDATLLARECDVTLTKRGQVPMSGIPAQTLDGYVEKLVAKGFLVAIAEQMESPKDCKSIVKREIVRIVSPGAPLLSQTLLDATNNYFAAITQVNIAIGVSFLDLSTGSLICLEIESTKALIDELAKKQPKELLVSEKFYKSNESLFEELKTIFPFRLSLKQEYYFDHQQTYNFLTKHFGVHSLDGFGLKGMISAINAIGALLHHVETDLFQNISSIKSVKLDAPSSYVTINHATAKHLDLVSSSNGNPKASLFALLNQTKTPMGSRLLREWILHPLLSLDEIEKRAKGVEELVNSPLFLEDLLSSIRDLERLAMRVHTKIANPRDLLTLGDSLEVLPLLKEALATFKSPILKETLPSFFDFSPIVRKIKTGLLENPPTKFTEGNIFKPGYFGKLDELKSLKEESEIWLSNYQTKLRESLDMKTLKVGYSKAFGYFIEASRIQALKMPLTFEKRQTLVNGERFISPELKEFEHKILHAEEKMIEMEKELFLSLRDEVSGYINNIQEVASKIALIDTLYSLAAVARDRGYQKPEVNESDVIEIRAGRHPILETFLKGAMFIPNDTYLSSSERSMSLITGPNMAGKSTFIRQVALIVIMAQIGSFVPASFAKIGVVDKVFSRIGASDDLARGQSTFMVEMSETASILHTATTKSLVILDEIGRGTSTYDGIAIASAVAEHLLKLGTKTLFATHFWELTKLETEYKTAKNYRVAVGENEDGIIFLHKILEGGADKSYGIQVAKLAGLPHDVIKRAQKLLTELEDKKWQKKKAIPKEEQFLLFSEAPLDDLQAKIKGLDLNKTTPLEAFQFLLKIQHEL
ncbi:MAG: DNA mismatch repair protein MutS [Chlamydiae bacterium]|nr:DNA mismatch repair protein MutS [Chlamydiota bacterium]